MPFSVDKFIKLFHSDETVMLYQYDEGVVNELVKKAAVLITDHSDIQYRFAYLNKPVIYYYPPALPVPQELKNESFAKNIFGKMLFDHDSLVDYIIEQMQKGFLQYDNYSKMCRSFFPYRDNNNCKRIFLTVKKIFLSDQYEQEQ